MARDVQEALAALTLRPQDAETETDELKDQLEEANQQSLEARRSPAGTDEVTSANHGMLNDLKGVKTQAPERYSGLPTLAYPSPEHF